MSSDSGSVSFESDSDEQDIKKQQVQNTNVSTSKILPEKPKQSSEKKESPVEVQQLKQQPLIESPKISEAETDRKLKKGTATSASSSNFSKGKSATGSKATSATNSTAIVTKIVTPNSAAAATTATASATTPSIVTPAAATSTTTTLSNTKTTNATEALPKSSSGVSSAQKASSKQIQSKVKSGYAGSSSDNSDSDNEQHGTTSVTIAKGKTSAGKGPKHSIVKQKIKQTPTKASAQKSSSATTNSTQKSSRTPSTASTNTSVPTTEMTSTAQNSNTKSDKPQQQQQQLHSSQQQKPQFKMQQQQQQQQQANSNNQHQKAMERATMRDVQVGYENKEALTVLTRSVLATADLRNFHNWIKSVLIKKYSEEAKQAIKKREDLPTLSKQLYVMEIACGMGGDLKKWLHAEIALYVGVDISFNSLKEAHRRSKDIMDKLHQDSHYKRFDYGFYQKDGSADPETFWKHIQDEEVMKDPKRRFFFDIVSCQMAMHYMFGSEEQARNFFRNATDKLNNHGYVLLTFSDANAIVKKMRSRSKYDDVQQKHIFQNKYFSMAFDSLDFQQTKPYGLKYGFYLQDAVGEKDSTTGVITYTPEYLVELTNLRKIALEYQLEIKENLNFIDFYKQYRFEYKDLFSSMRLDNFNDEHPNIDPDLWEISHCYRVIVFQKKDPQCFSNEMSKKYEFKRNTKKDLSKEPIPQHFVAPQRQGYKH